MIVSKAEIDQLNMTIMMELGKILGTRNSSESNINELDTLKIAKLINLEFGKLRIPAPIESRFPARPTDQPTNSRG